MLSCHRLPTRHVMVKVAYTRLPSIGFRSWSRFLAVSLKVTWVINPEVGCHYFPSGPQLPMQPLTGLLPISLLGEQRHDGREQFAQDCYPTASRLRFVLKQFCTWVQHANQSATESSYAGTRGPKELNENYKIWQLMYMAMKLRRTTYCGTHL